MSNKTLGIVIAVIVIAFGAFFVYRLKNPGGVDIKDALEEEQKKQSEQSQSQSRQPVQELNQSSKESGQTQECKRNFDENKLKTAKVDIKNRQVEMDFKDFGKVTLEFFDKDAPKTVENFLRLANSGYYDCLTIHRVAKGFVIQGGDPTGTGSGGDSAFGGEFADEINPNSQLYKDGYKKGILAMANRGPNTNTSQFFILLGDVQLPPSYTIFGKVIVGQEAVDKIGQVEIVPQLGPNDGKPVVPVVTQSVKITK